MITGSEDRQHAYVALSRGTEVNLAYVFTHSPKTADPAPGPRPAPELARYDRRAAAPGGPAAPATAADPLAVLAGVLDRDGQQHSATQTRHQALADADHLAILHAVWAAETTPARDQAYRVQLVNTLPPGYRREPGHQARWLWRTLDPATSPPSSTPASGTGSAPWSRCRPGRGRSRSPPSPTPNIRPTWLRSPR